MDIRRDIASFRRESHKKRKLEKFYELHQKNARDVVALRNALRMLPETKNIEAESLDTLKNKIALLDDESEIFLVDEMQGTDSKSSEVILAVDIEFLFVSITICTFDSLDTTVRTDNTILPVLEGYWLDSLSSTNRDIMEAEATKCNGPIRYGTHFKSLLHIEAHFSVQSMLGERLPLLKNPHSTILSEVGPSSFLKVDIDKATPSSLLLNMNDTCSDPKL